MLAPPDPHQPQQPAGSAGTGAAGGSLRWARSSNGAGSLDTPPTESSRVACPPDSPQLLPTAPNCLPEQFAEVVVVLGVIAGQHDAVPRQAGQHIGEQVRGCIPAPAGQQGADGARLGGADPWRPAQCSVRHTINATLTRCGAGGSPPSARCHRRHR
jgi:hypothetical protein